ncbi:MAG: hypothetical protein ACRDSL_07785 [Pseudonocardiaceae bacterium]
MPEPEDLRRTQAHGQTVITVGSWVIACFDPADLGMRNITVLTLTEALSFTGRRMSQVMGLTPEYVSELRGRAHREGSAGTICARVRGGLHERLTTVLQSTAPTWGSIAVRSGEHGVAHLAYHRSWCGTSASAPCLQ